MSGESGIIVGGVAAVAAGAVVIPLVVGGGLLAGTAFAIRGIAGAARRAHDESVRRRINSAYSKASGLLSETANIQSEIHASMANASGSICEAYANSVDDLNKAFSEEPDTSKFVEQYEISKREFSTDFENSLAAIEKKYTSSIEAAVNKTKAAVDKEREDILSSVKAMKDDIAEREEKSRAAANDVIEKAGTIIREFSENHKNNAHANDYAVSLNNALNAAIDRYNGGQYEAALIDAYDVYSKCVITVETLLSEDTKTDFLYERCAAGIAELESHLDSTHIVDYEFSDTVDGEPVKYSDLDMTVYFNGKREEFQSRAEQIKAQLAAKERSGFTPEELIDLITLTDDLNIQYVKETAAAFERLHNHCERIQYADIITASYTEIGFEEVEPDETPSPLESIVVQMEDQSSGEVVKIFLNARTDENSHLSTGIDILDHCETIDHTTETRRAAQRENVCSALMNSDYGKRRGMVATQKCRGGTVGKNAF